jgi:predicted MFS family arabinose efflux permease
VGADEFLLGPILTPIGIDLSTPPERIALFITAYSLPLAIMAPVLGSLSDRYGRLAILLPSTILFGFASVATSFAPSFETGILTRILTGIASGGMLGIAMAMAGDLGEKAAPKAIAYVTSGLTLGIILSPGIGALSVQIWSWRVAFAALGGLALIVALLCLLFLRTTHHHPDQSATNGNTIKEPLFIPGVWASLIAMTVGLGGAIGCFALVGERLRALFDWNTPAISAVYATFGILTLVGNIVMPWALARAGSGRALMRFALMFVLAAIVVTYAFDSLGPFVIGLALLVWAIFGGMGAPGLQTHIAQLSQSRRGSLMALAGSGMNLGVAGTSALAAIMYPTGAVWVSALAFVLIGTAILVLRPTDPRNPKPVTE